MLIIILGTIISLAICFVFTLIMKDEIPVFIGTAGIICSILAGLFFPTQYGERELVKQTELVSLSNSTVSEGELFVSVSGENVYTYRYEIDTDLGTETSHNYVTASISHYSGNIIESEDVNCKTPVLLEYKTKSKITIWSFGLFADKTDYVFYVPEGTIQKSVKLE